MKSIIQIKNYNLTNTQNIFTALFIIIAIVFYSLTGAPHVYADLSNQSNSDATDQVIKLESKINNKAAQKKFFTTQGIYVSQTTFENVNKLKYLIEQAKIVGIDTFVIDMSLDRKKYADSMNIFKASNLKYVARIELFPGGGEEAQIKNPAYWQSKYHLVESAIKYGASAIQLDYIRYNTKQVAKESNIADVTKIITWYKKQLSKYNIPLQTDIFGIASFKDQLIIGQSVVEFGKIVDVLCPMNYPSHFVPFEKNFKDPYRIVYLALTNIKNKFKEYELLTKKQSMIQSQSGSQQSNELSIKAKIINYIELSNYHYSMSDEKAISYIVAQLQAMADAGVHGWYAWSAGNKYKNLFIALKKYNITPSKIKKVDSNKEIVNKKYKMRYNFMKNNSTSSNIHLPTGDNPPEIFNVYIEIAANSSPIKYELDKSSQTLFVDRFIGTAMSYPVNYGFIPNTLAGDGDPLDALVITPFPLLHGSVIRARTIGVLHMEDESGMDKKLICVPIQKVSHMYDHVKSVDDLPQTLLDQIKHFFEHYKDLEQGKWVKITGWGNADEAKHEIIESIERYRL